MTGFHGLVSKSIKSIGYYGSAVLTYSPFLSSDVAATNQTNNSSVPIVKINHSREFDFEFAYDVGILALSDEVLRTHKFEIVNVTLSGT